MSLDSLPASHPAQTAGASLADVAAIARDCTLCKLAAGRTQVVFGVGRADADLMFVGEGPGEQEDLRGEPFVGRAGQLLTQLIEGIELTRAEVYIANVVKCRPPGNRDPQPDEIASCAPWLDRQLELIRPRVIMTLGNFATKLLLDTKEGITRLRGQEFAFTAPASTQCSSRPCTRPRCFGRAARRSPRRGPTSFTSSASSARVHEGPQPVGNGDPRFRGCVRDGARTG